MKVLFYGFQHGHILSLYEKVRVHEELEIVACAEDDEKKREELSASRGISFASGSFTELLSGDFHGIFPHLWWVIGYALVALAAAVILVLRQMKKQ